MKDATIPATAQDLVKAFDERSKHHGLGAAETARTFHDLNILLSDTPKAKLPLRVRAKLASQILAESASPGEINQGCHSTCMMTAVEKVLYWHEPSIVAKVVAEVAITGRYLDLDLDGNGQAIKIPPSTLVGGQEENWFTLGSNSRSLASQIFQVTSVNLASQRRTPPQIYEQTASVSNQENGERLYFANGQLRTYSDGQPVRQPAVTFSEMAYVFKRLSGRSYVILANKHADQSKDVLNFGSAEELHSMLQTKQRQFPVILLVDVNSKSFGAQQAPLQSLIKSFQHEPAWHVITVQAIQGDKAFVSNQWGASSNRWMPIADLYRTTLG